MQRVSRFSRATSGAVRQPVRNYVVMANTPTIYDTSKMQFEPISPISRRLNSCSREMWAIFLVKQSRPMVWDEKSATLHAKAYVKFWSERKMIGRETEEEAITSCTNALLGKTGPQEVPTQILNKAYGKNWAADILEFYKNADFSEYANQIFYPFLPTTAVKSLRTTEQIVDKAFELAALTLEKQKYDEEQFKLKLQH